MIDVSQPPRLNEVGWGKRGRGVVNVVVCLFFTGPILHNAEIRISICPDFDISDVQILDIYCIQSSWDLINLGLKFDFDQKWPILIF